MAVVEKKEVICWMNEENLCKVLEIEENFPYSWSENDFIDHLHEKDVIGMV